MKYVTESIGKGNRPTARKKAPLLVFFEFLLTNSDLIRE
jgi:hypothetical protein